jgi:L-alanine-DL-glutamate epimerase-like enolase superfamily enzyme
MDRRHFLQTLSLSAALLPAARLQAAMSSPGPLASHRIADVTVRQVSLRWPRLVGKNAKRDVHGYGPSVAVVVLRTDHGATGWGEAPGGRAAVDKLRERVVGRTVDVLFAPTTGIRAPELKPFDIALHDLAGVILGIPVWRMIGGGATPQLAPLYSGMVYFDDLEPASQPAGLDRVLENCAWDRAHGYRQLKVKIGRGGKWLPGEAGLRRDIEVVRAIAAAFPDCQLLVDGNDGFTVATIIAFLEGIAGIPLVWLEEPFIENVAAWKAVHVWTRAHGRADTLLADGEQNNDFPVLEELEAAGVLQVRLTDILGLGFTAWRALMPRLRATRTLASPHNWGSALKTVYTAHLAAALGNVPTIEGVTTVTTEVDFGENVLRAGCLHVSSQPGFGLRLNPS